ncbi:MAG: helix-turn-helix domain-containing protein [Bacteroidia bacterium]
MEEKTIYIKNMVCSCCIKVVTDELKTLGLQLIEVKLGEVTYIESPTIPIVSIKNSIEKNGFEIITKKDEQLVELIKIAVIDIINNHPDILYEEKAYRYLAKLTDKPYPYLSKIFSRHKKITIEKYFILQKIEKAKEFIEYDELTFSEIAYRLGYKSVQHLSSQFKEIVGMSKTEYLKQRIHERKSIDEI